MYRKEIYHNKKDKITISMIFGEGTEKQVLILAESRFKPAEVFLKKRGFEVLSRKVTGFSKRIRLSLIFRNENITEDEMTILLLELFHLF